MITNETTIVPSQVIDVPMITRAKMYYRKWKSSVPFDVDLKDYLENGVVICRPDLFGMMKLVDDPKYPEEKAWFVRMAIGDLRKLVTALRGSVNRICFCRRNDPRVRSYSLERLLHLATKG